MRRAGARPPLLPTLPPPPPPPSYHPPLSHTPPRPPPPWPLPPPPPPLSSPLACAGTTTTPALAAAAAVATAASAAANSPARRVPCWLRVGPRALRTSVWLSRARHARAWSRVGSWWWLVVGGWCMCLWFTRVYTSYGTYLEQWRVGGQEVEVPCEGDADVGHGCVVVFLCVFLCVSSVLVLCWGGKEKDEPPSFFGGGVYCVLMTKAQQKGHTPHAPAPSQTHRQTNNIPSSAKGARAGSTSAAHTAGARRGAVAGMARAACTKSCRLR